MPAIQDSQVGSSQGPADNDDDDDDVVELIEISSQDSNQMCSDEQNIESASQEDSQESVMNIAEEVEVRSANGANGGGDLPEWTANNRGANSVTGIEPSRDNPSRSMDELRQNPNDVIICSMPDVEAYFCEHIVKYSSYVPSLSDKVTFGKPSYSCPECGESGLRGVALKQHLENHIGKTIKWKTLIKNPPLTSESESELQQMSPMKYRTMTKVKKSATNSVLIPSKMKLSPRKRDGGRNGVGGISKHQVRQMGQTVRKARHNFNSVLGRILQRERNLRWGKLTRSPVKRLNQLGTGNCRSFGRSSMRYGNTPIRNLENDLSTQANQGQSSSAKDADTVKQSHKPTGVTQVSSKQGNHGDSCNSKSDASQPCEVIDLVDDDAIEIGSVGSEDVEMENVSENGQVNQKASVGVDEPQGDDLFLTIDDILKEHFTKEEKQRSRKGVNGMNFVVVQYRCRRCNFATLTVLDVPEHVAFHIKRKVILKIKMDK